MWKVETGWAPLFSEAVVLWKVRGCVVYQSLGLHLLVAEVVETSGREVNVRMYGLPKLFWQNGLAWVSWFAPQRENFLSPKFGREGLLRVVPVPCAGGGTRAWGPGL